MDVTHIRFNLKLHFKYIFVITIIIIVNVFKLASLALVTVSDY